MIALNKDPWPEPMLAARCHRSAAPFSCPADGCDLATLWATNGAADDENGCSLPRVGGSAQASPSVLDVHCVAGCWWRRTRRGMLMLRAFCCYTAIDDCFK